MINFPLFPDQASTIAGQVDTLFYVLLGVSTVIVFIVFGLILFFAIRYRKGNNVNRVRQYGGEMRLEIFWTGATLGVGLVVFAWAANLFFAESRPPSNALEIYVVGQQWMWKIQHPDGQREINELHIPVGVPVKLIMISQDVIHSFYVPDFRVKADLLPGRYTTLWFEASKPGEYHLFCAEYCGAQHAGMGGTVYALDPAAYQQWLSSSEPSLASVGEGLFQKYGCVSCHLVDGSGTGPSLVGIFGTTVQFEDGRTATVDESYLRRSILNPQADIVAGYSGVMPTFEGQLSEEELVQLIDYVKSLEP